MSFVMIVSRQVEITNENKHWWLKVTLIVGEFFDEIFFTEAIHVTIPGTDS